MKITIEKQNLKFYPYLLEEMNFNISDKNYDISLNLRGASLVCDFETKKLTIVTNITVEIDYNAMENSSLKESMKKDLKSLKSMIKESRKNKYIV